jgi:hypothetical protein
MLRDGQKETKVGENSKRQTRQGRKEKKREISKYSEIKQHIKTKR